MGGVYGFALRSLRKRTLLAFMIRAGTLGDLKNYCKVDRHPVRLYAHTPVQRTCEAAQLQRSLLAVQVHTGGGVAHSVFSSRRCRTGSEDL